MALPAVPGDVNGDGQVTIVDVALLVDELCDGDPNAQSHPPGADANLDGRVSAADLTATLVLLEAATPTPLSETSTPTPTPTPTPTFTVTPTSLPYCVITGLGTLPPTSGTVTASVSAPGTLSSEDCLRFFGEPSPAARNTDVYQLSSTTGCTLGVKVVADGFPPYVAAFNTASGDQVAAGVPPVEFIVSAVPVDIQVTSAPDQPAAFGSYTVTITQRSCP